MEDIQERLGMLVFSAAGRDFGRPYLIVALVDDKNVLVADGALRRIGNPKRKNIKHLNLTGLTEYEIRVKLQGGTFPCDATLRKAIAELVTDQNIEQRG